MAVDLRNGLKAYWRMNTGSGVTDPDLVGSHTLTLQSATLWSGSPSPLFGSSIDTDPLNLSVSTNIPINVHTSVMSFGGWIMRNDSTDYKHAVQIRNADPYILIVHRSDRGGLAYQYLAGNAAYVDFGSSMDVGSWYFFVVTKNGNAANNLNLYLNGSVKASTTANYIFEGTGNINIGTDGDQQGFNHSQFFYYNRILTAEEVAVLYNNGSGLDIFTSNTISSDSIITDTVSANINSSTSIQQELESNIETNVYIKGTINSEIPINGYIKGTGSSTINSISELTPEFLVTQSITSNTNILQESNLTIDTPQGLVLVSEKPQITHVINDFNKPDVVTFKDEKPIMN